MKTIIAIGIIVVCSIFSGCATQDEIEKEERISKEQDAYIREIEAKYLKQ